MKALDKKYKEKGALFVLFALALPLLLLFIGFAIDIGLLYLAKNRLQTVADSAALAAATYRTSESKKGNLGNSISNSTLTVPKMDDDLTKDVALGICDNIAMYLSENNIEIAAAEGAQGKAGSKSNPYSSLAFEYTNFEVYHEDVYDGPEIGNNEDNINKVAVQCGVPVDYRDRVRVRLRKMVPTIFMHALLGGYDNGIAVTVVSAAAQRKPSSPFRIVGMHGIYVNHTDMVTSDLNSFNMKGYIEGDIYAGDILSTTLAHNDKNHDGVDNYDTNKQGYGANMFTFKGNLYARQLSTGMSTTSKVSAFPDIFASEKSIKDGAIVENYLYQRYDEDKKTYVYTTDENTVAAAGTDGSGNSVKNPWKHVYNFDRIINWQRIKEWDEDEGRFVNVRPHRIRLGLSGEKEKLEFKEATGRVRLFRKQYLVDMELAYKEAREKLGKVSDTEHSESRAYWLQNRDSEWRYLVSSKETNPAVNSLYQYCSIDPVKDNGKTIKLLVEIQGKETNSYDTTYGVTGSQEKFGGKNYRQPGGALAYLGNNAFPEQINIEQVVVIVRDNWDVEGKNYTHKRDANNRRTFTSTGAFISIPSTAATDATGYKKVTWGDIYSEANLSFMGKLNTFSGIIFSAKNIIFPVGAYSTNDNKNSTHHIYGGSCTMLGDRIIFGYQYHPGNLKAGLDYPIGFFNYARHAITTKDPNDQTVPMHKQLLDMSDEEYHSVVFTGDYDYANDDDDVNEAGETHLGEIACGHGYTGSDPVLQGEFKYLPFNPNGRLSFISTPYMKPGIIDRYNTIQKWEPNDGFSLFAENNYESKTDTYKGLAWAVDTPDTVFNLNLRMDNSKDLDGQQRLQRQIPKNFMIKDASQLLLKDISGNYYKESDDEDNAVDVTEASPLHKHEEKLPFVKTLKDNYATISLDINPDNKEINYFPGTKVPKHVVAYINTSTVEIKSTKLNELRPFYIRSKYPYLDDKSKILDMNADTNENGILDINETTSVDQTEPILANYNKKKADYIFKLEDYTNPNHWQSGRFKLYSNTDNNYLYDQIFFTAYDKEATDANFKSTGSLEYQMPLLFSNANLREENQLRYIDEGGDYIALTAENAPWKIWWRGISMFSSLTLNKINCAWVETYRNVDIDKENGLFGYNTNNRNGAKEETNKFTKDFLVSIDLEYWVEYSTDNMHQFIDGAPKAFSDGKGVRYFDDWTKSYDDSGFGNGGYPGRTPDNFGADVSDEDVGAGEATPSDNTKAILARHIFGLKADTPYAEVRLVE